MRKLFLGIGFFFNAILSAMQTETDRLILRQWQEGDADKLFSILQKPEVNHYLQVFNISKRESVESLINRGTQSINENGYGYFACQEKQSDELIGYIGLNYIAIQEEPFPCYTLSWCLDTTSWGKGYATEAAALLIRLAFEKFDIQELCACTVELNEKSRKVMERIGMKYKSSFDFPGVDKAHPHCKHVLYSITKDDHIK